MKWKYILTAIILATLTFSSQAQRNKGNDHVIYKWIDGGLVYYSYIQPDDISNVTKLNADGMEIINYNPGNFETVTTLPKKVARTPDQEQTKPTPQEKTAKEKNCDIAKENLKKLSGNTVYQKDNKGNFVKMTADEIAAKKKNSQKDVDYFCTP